MDSVQSPRQQTIEVRSSVNRSPLAGGNAHLNMTNQGNVGVSVEAMAWWDDIIMKRPNAKKGHGKGKGSTHRLGAQHVGASTQDSLAAESTRRGSIDDSLIGGPSTASANKGQSKAQQQTISYPSFHVQSVPVSPDKSKQAKTGRTSRRYLHNQAPQIMVNEEGDPMLSALKNTKKTRNYNPEQANVQNLNVLDASMISHHNASQVTLRGHLRMNDNNPNLFESFHSLQKPSLHNQSWQTLDHTQSGNHKETKQEREIRDLRERFGLIKQHRESVKESIANLSTAIQSQESQPMVLASGTKKHSEMSINQMTLDRMYDQSSIGPGSYEHHSQFPGKKDWAVKLSLSNNRRERPTYRFGLDKKANQSRFFSNEHAQVENLLRHGAPHSNYSPKDTLTRTSVGLGLKGGETQPRFDEYSYKKMVTKAPSPSEYHVKDQTNISYGSPHKVQNDTFGNGPRFNEDYYYSMKIPLKIDYALPSPIDYLVPSTFHVNKNRGPLFGAPSNIRVDGDHQAPFTDTLGQFLEKRKQVEAQEKKPLGPADYNPSHQGQLSKSPMPPSVKIGTAIQRDDSFLTSNIDINMNVCPGQYNEKKFISPKADHVSLEKGLKIGIQKKDFDFRRVGWLQVKDHYTYKF